MESQPKYTPRKAGVKVSPAVPHPCEPETCYLANRDVHALTPLSLCIIVKNAAAVLPRCLASVAGLASQIVVVDTGSSDGTPAVAARLGAEVATFDFTRVDFAAARNHALAHAIAPWILVLDADESLQPAGVPLVRDLVLRNENAGYYLERINHQGAGEPTTDYVVRLFPNRPGYRYRGRVHETIDASILAAGGRLLRTSVRIDHDFAADPEARRRRNLWYIRILQEEIAADPADLSRLDFLAAEYHQLGMFREAAEIAEHIALLRPLDPEAHLHAGVYHLLYVIDRPRARADFEQALKLRPGYPEALSFLELLGPR
jgi:tetratricopeptide (TPR) repeat protein